MKLPTFEEMGVRIDRFEIEQLSPSCVRLVAWSGRTRLLMLTADPRNQADLCGLMEVPEVFLALQAGLDRREVWRNIRSRRNRSNRRRR